MRSPGRNASPAVPTAAPGPFVEGFPKAPPVSTRAFFPHFLRCFLEGYTVSLPFHLFRCSGMRTIVTSLSDFLIYFSRPLLSPSPKNYRKREERKGQGPENQWAPYRTPTPPPPPPPPDQPPGGKISHVTQDKPCDAPPLATSPAQRPHLRVHRPLPPPPLPPPPRLPPPPPPPPHFTPSPPAPKAPTPVPFTRHFFFGNSSPSLSHPPPLFYTRNSLLRFRCFPFFLLEIGFTFPSNPPPPPLQKDHSLQRLFSQSSETLRTVFPSPSGGFIPSETFSRRAPLSLPPAVFFPSPTITPSPIRTLNGSLLSMTNFNVPTQLLAFVRNSPPGENPSFLVRKIFHLPLFIVFPSLSRNIKESRLESFAGRENFFLEGVPQRWARLA